MLDKSNLVSKFSQIHEYWSPHVAGELNGQMVKLVKIKGEFVWHHHDNQDELFMVLKGRFRMEFLDSMDTDYVQASVRSTRHKSEDKSVRATRTVGIEEGEFIIVPRGVEHKPVADEECWILLVEPASTLNTGNVVNQLTRRELERL